jgi:hypothetical protein
MKSMEKKNKSSPKLSMNEENIWNSSTNVAMWIQRMSASFGNQGMFSLIHLKNR